MPKYLLLKHYRGGPEPHRPVPRWTSGPPRTWRRTWPSLSTSASCWRRTASTSTRRRGPDVAPVTTDGPGGEPLYEWVDVREVMSEAPGRGRMPPRLSRGHG
jgi:hypothetical protein